ncbi:MAG: DUF2318 domain-containing protein [Oscillospiraceae bacterium]|nr:DUF2318 domain-containing protein [Oscillospiraceae bacterium]
MLKYLITGTQSLIVAGVLLGMLLAYHALVYGKLGRRIVGIGALVGLVGAIVMSYLKNKTKLIDTGAWNIRIFTVTACALLLLIVLDAVGPLRRRKFPAVPVLGGLLAGLLLFYVLPDVLAYPYTIVLGGTSVVSTDFIYRMIGLVLSVLLVALSTLAVHNVCLRVSPGLVGTLMKVALGINSLQQISKIVQTLLARRIIVNHTLFQIVKFTSNHSDWFIYATLLVALVCPVLLWVRSFHVNEPYENPAQHRKIRAKWRTSRRWSTTVIVCMALVTLTLTAINAYANRPVELSPTEECELRGDSLYISFEQVEDGHLHRFAYTTDNNITVRLIVIKKPNSSAYGIGLDACDICGETGYYERNGQVVCNRCDVVMNVNTIGFKGGCNPIVIDYRIEGGYIIVPTETLVEHEKEFK